MGNQQSTHYGQRVPGGPVALTPSMIQGPNVKYGAPGPSVGGIVVNEPNSMTNVAQTTGQRLVWDPDRHGYWVHEGVPVQAENGRPPYIAAIHEITPYGPRLVDSIVEPEDEIIKVVRRKKKKVESSDSESSDDEPVVYVPVVVPTGPTEFYPAPRARPFDMETQVQSRAIGGCGGYTGCHGCM
jgi:hypothetical protein